MSHYEGDNFSRGWGRGKHFPLRRGEVFQWEEKMFCIEKGEPLFVGEGKVYFSKGKSFPVKGETFPCQRGK